MIFNIVDMLTEKKLTKFNIDKNVKFYYWNGIQR